MQLDKIIALYLFKELSDEEQEVLAGGDTEAGSPQYKVYGSPTN